MNQVEIKRRIDNVRMQCPYWYDESQFIANGRDFEVNHEFVEASRLLFIGAYEKAVIPVLEKHIDQRSGGPVLEEGSGMGFFSRQLAPDWLKERLISFDINPIAVKSNKNKDAESAVFLGSVYRIPIRTESIDGVVGFSSFDSLIHLPRALNECMRVLRPGGKLILFQDLTIDLYEFGEKLSIEESVGRTENYHRLLAEEAEDAGFEIVEGKEDLLEAEFMESIDDVKKRVRDFEIPRELTPIVVNWNRGFFEPYVRSSTRKAQGVSKRKYHGLLKKKLGELRKSGFFEKWNAGHEDVVELLKMRYLVLQKPK